MKKDLWVFAAIIWLAVFVSACQISDQELGEDLLPPGDDVFLFHDTIFDIHAWPVQSAHVTTSEINFDPETLYLLGNWEDTIVGSAVASIVTQFNSNGSFVNGPNMTIDSIMFFLHVNDYVGDMTQEITLTLYEFNERIYMDSTYYSDYDIEGRYNPVPLAVKRFVPEDQDTLAMLITNQEFIDKWLALEDTTYTSSDSIFKDYFNGLYITAESAAPSGSMARIQLSSDYSLLSVKYANDSTDVDTTAGQDFKWAQFSIEEYYSQKINIFEHDFSGTSLAGTINNDSAEIPYAYVQGMAGVNTILRFTDLKKWMDKAPIAINSARLILEVVPETESGILDEDLPDRLMIGTILGDESFEPLYDYVVLASNSAQTSFGGYKKAKSEGMFYDTTYVYTFNMGLHFQAMVDGAKEDNQFILKVADGRYSPKITKLWSNLPANKNRIRLEIVYLKL
ncbi:MAG: DUF4270 family protein [Bacteroidales bacterium]